MAKKDKELLKMKVEECDPVAAAEARPLYSSGIYEVRCNKTVTYLDPGYHRVVTLLRCHLLGRDEPVVAFLNRGAGETAKMGRRSNYWKAWCLANGGPPRKGQVMSKRIFEGKNFRVRIAEAGPLCDRYSKIVEILECTWRGH
jgi:hypothetical protein